MFFVYILECADHSLYVGVAENAQRRLEEHNAGKGADWTVPRRPVKLMWNIPPGPRREDEKLKSNAGAIRRKLP
jgi:putative endonuclease